MPETPRQQTDEPTEKYFAFQIKGWTNFDPIDKTLAGIAEGIEQGGGFLTLVEVLKSENDLASIPDDEVRECFANILAAQRLIRNVHELPSRLLIELRSALKVEEEVVPKKAAASVASLPVSADPELRTKSWP